MSASERASGQSGHLLAQFDAKNVCAQPKQQDSRFIEWRDLRRRLKERGPAGFELRQIGPADASRQKFGSCSLQPWFCRDLTQIELVEALTPPRQLDRRKRRLGRSRNHVGHCILDVEQRIECRPQMRRPIKPD